MLPIRPFNGIISLLVFENLWQNQKVVLQNRLIFLGNLKKLVKDVVRILVCLLPHVTVEENVIVDKEYNR